MKKAVIGFLLFCLYWLRFGGTRRAKQAFYKEALKGNSRIVGFLTGIIGRMAVDYSYAVSNKDRDRISPSVLENYRNNDPHRWYNETHKDVKNSGGKLLEIEKQQRGLIIPEIRFALEDLGLGEGSPDNSKKISTFDLGCSDGLLASYVSNISSQIESRGMDLSLAGVTAVKRDSNVQFCEGYFLDVADQNPGDFESIDLLYCTSTMCFFFPAELKRFISKFKQLGIKSVVISEPMWAGFQPTGAAVVSCHLEAQVWFHDYLAYFKAEGYQSVRSRCDPYIHPISTRPDIRVFVGNFSLS